MDIRRVRRLLRETARIAEHASLTGSLQKGSRLAVKQYNAIRQHLEDTGAIPEDLFPELDEDESDFDELGVAAKLLDGYLDDEDESSSPENKNKHKRFEFNFGSTSDMHDLRSFGEIIRSQMPEILREHFDVKIVPPTPTPPVPPAPPTHGFTFTSDYRTGGQETRTEHTGQFDVEVNTEDPSERRIGELIGQLRSSDLSEEKRAEIAAEIVRLAQQPR